MSRGLAALTVVVALVAISCGGGPDRVVVAAGTTLVDGGFLDAVVARYEAGNGADLSVVAEATRQVLELGRRGAADLLVTHAPDAEDAFLAEGEVAQVTTVFSSRFLLVGPTSSVTELHGLDPVAAITRIASEGWAFVARDDGSGTSERERLLWELAGVDPTGAAWYDVTGQGMGLTLQVADQRGAFTLTEEGAFLGGAGALDLEPVALVGHPDLLGNPYRAIVVAGPGEAGAAAFVTWLLSAEGEAAITEVNEELFGRQVYLPPSG